MIVGTPASRELCEEIAQLTDTVILGYSRGKDTIAAYLWLKQFFPRIITFYNDPLPIGTLGIVERSIRYQEEKLGIEIERVYDDSLMLSLGNLIYQHVELEDALDALEFHKHAYDRNVVVELLRAKHRIPNAWVAWGISMLDSPFRRCQNKLRVGFVAEKKAFYPLMDWSRQQIIQTVEDAGVLLGEEYRLANRSIGGALNGKHLDRMLEQYPDDFKRLEDVYPLIRAGMARGKFRAMHFAGIETDAESPEDVAE